uniref:Progestin and adipoQ receptor family member 6 n=1 Tax=Rodentolepis nana TaxID=102285 RepID=A0A0R3TK25_RODNA
LKPYIYTGYRKQTDFLGSIRSLFHLHNESFNCWSHIFGLPMIMLYVLEEYNSPSSNPIAYIYLFGCFCFAFGSSFGHTFCCYDRFTRHASFTIDYIGLTIFTYSGLFGFSFLETIMRSVIRVSSFASPAFLMSSPILYKIVQCFYEPSIYPQHYCDSSTIWPKQFISCITACLFYISRFPECMYPGKFDYFGHSHNVFHIGALLGLQYQKTALFYDLKFVQLNKQTSSIPIEIAFVCLVFLFLSILFTCFCFRHLFSLKHKAPAYKSNLL